MSLIAISDSLLIIALKSKLIFVEKVEETWKCVQHTLDITLPILAKKPVRFLPDSDGGPEAEPSSEATLQIQNVAATERFLAVSATDKTLFLFSFNVGLRGRQLSLKSRRKLARNTSALKFFPNEEQLLVSDKTGDVFLYNCKLAEEPGKWILGHISQVLDILVDSKLEYILSCDRDEKIRVSRYPDSHEIESFCLGHKEFVSSIQFIQVKNKDFLLSGSGDCSIKVSLMIKSTN